jgi:2,3,4,5-tetrahydropyridine-2-carboxylate N-succinyltransferase
MNHDALKSVIDAAWEIRDQLTQQTMGEIRDAVNTALNQLDSGEARVASKGEDRRLGGA